MATTVWHRNCDCAKEVIGVKLIVIVYRHLELAGGVELAERDEYFQRLVPHNIATCLGAGVCSEGSACVAHGKDNVWI